jgi:3-dehydroquinate synthase
MKRITIKADRRYQILVDTDYSTEISNIAKAHQRVVLIAPAKLLKIIKLKKISNLSLISVPDGELQKDVRTLERIWNELGRQKISRADAIIGLGGGATTDLAGFAAATWLRGITWYAIPTSLAAMVDAAIGGKTAINSLSGKNLIGAFYSPSAVYIDLQFLQTLPARDLSAGMAEVIKCGFISDKNILKLVQEDVVDFKELIYRSIKVKADVVNKDFKESKLREILNYGHTLGHAIEKHSKFKLRHGEAVSIGLIFAAELSNIVGDLPADIVEEHRRILASFNLPISYPKQHLAALENLMISDKKVKGNQIRFIGLKRIGKPTWYDSVNSKQIKMAYERIVK